MSHKYSSLKYILDHADQVLIVAHSRPDPDTIGSTVALYDYLLSQDVTVTLACSDIFPPIFDTFLPQYKRCDLASIDPAAYDVIIGCDNIDRGFDRVMKQINPDKHVTVGIDHHPHTHLHPDVLITDPHASSTCEILYDFFCHIGHVPTSHQASALTIGILGDTRLFHNPNTSAHVLDIIANLLDAHTPLITIIKDAFLTKRLATLQLWGSALHGAKRLSPSGAIISVITQKHLQGKDIPKEELKEELKEVASLLCSVPHTPFALVLIQLDNGIVKGSIRTEKGSGIDTSQIASFFGGGGHKLASGFEIRGTLTETADSWHIV